MGYLGLTKVLMYALLFSAGINSVSSLAAFQSGYMYNRKAANFNPPIESKMTCDDFFNVLSTSPVPVKTIDKALEIVAQKRPKYLDYYTLAYQSRSLHDASFSDPRAIVYGYDGKFVLTFNGNPQQAGYENIEIMCFNDTLKQFEFREVTFPNEARDKKQLDDLTIEQKALAYVVSPLNGSPHRRCTACHKENARPIWESYPFWPGIYGSQDDYVANHKFRKMFTSEPLEERFFRDVKGVEVSQYLAFEKEKPNKPRYKWLGSPSPMEVGQPNFYINLVFQVLNGQRISRQLQEKKDRLIPLRYQLVQSLYCYQDRIVPMKFKFSSHQFDFPVIKKPFSVSEQNILEINIDDLYERLLRMKAVLGRNGIAPLSGVKGVVDQRLIERLAPYVTTPGPWRAKVYELKGPISLLDPDEVVVETRLEPILKSVGLELTNWSMKSEGDGYMFNDGEGAADPALTRLVDADVLATLFSQSESAFSERLIKRGNSGAYDEAFCAEVQKNVNSD